MSRKLTQEEFITKANHKHNYFYGYSKVKYVNAKVKITIECKQHGFFEQQADSHLRGRGCGECALLKKKTNVFSKKMFIEKSENVHGKRYGYSLVIYVNDNTKVEVICSEHGSFWQRANAHWSGQGCPNCGDDSRAISQTMTQAQFEQKANTVHGFKYGYQNAVYISSGDKITINCPDHQDFEQSPGDHLQGKGCSKCGDLATSLQNRKTHVQFIQDCVNKHGDKYDYSETVYVNDSGKIKIRCPVPGHGPFLQHAGSHINGCGCPSCSASKGEIAIQSFLQSSNIAFHANHPLPGCNYRFDFYLYKHDLVIEFDGIQHFKKNDFFHQENSRRNFSEEQINDESKDLYIVQEGLKILRIPFWERHNIDDILVNALLTGEGLTESIVKYSLQKNRKYFESTLALPEN